MKPKTTTSRVYNRLSQLLSQKKTDIPDETKSSLLSDYDDLNPNKGKTFEMKVKKRHESESVSARDEQATENQKKTSVKPVKDDSSKSQTSATDIKADSQNQQAIKKNISTKNENEKHINDSWRLYGSPFDPYKFSVGFHSLPSILKAPAVAIKNDKTRLKF